MKSMKTLAVVASVTIFFAACQKNIKESETQIAETLSVEKNGIAGYVYTLSNQVAGNNVLMYSRTASGMLSYVMSYSTGGTGTGTGLGNQGAVALSGNEQILLAVNPGSNTVSSFTISGSTLQLKSTVSSGGVRPVSVTIYNDLVYVLNQGGTGNISGFKLQDNGMLQPLAGSTRPLSSTTADAAQVSFVSGGYAVAITEKMTNKITSYTIGASGLPGVMHTLTSVNTTPFGFAVGKSGIIYVTEAAGGAPGASTVSSYYVSTDGTISLVEGPVSAGQTAACWAVVTNNGKYVYATNTGSNNISSFNAKHDLAVLEAVAGSGNAPIDAALSNNSKFLFVLNSGNETINAFAVNNNGSLDFLQTVSGLPDGATGLAAK